MPFDLLVTTDSAAKAAAKLSHPHIVTVFDAGAQDHQCYLVMERLLGKDLRDLLASGWRPEIREALQVGRRIADALGYAHAKGVIHRDIKPGNIFMVGRTQPRILDFGIARRTGAGQTQSGAASTDNEIAVSPFYAAPELLQGGPVDSRADVFSVGVLLYELLTGLRPFDAAKFRRAAVDEMIETLRKGANPLDDKMLMVAKAHLAALVALHAKDVRGDGGPAGVAVLSKLASIHA